MTRLQKHPNILRSSEFLKPVFLMTTNKHVLYTVHTTEHSKQSLNFEREFGLNDKNGKNEHQSNKTHNRYILIKIFLQEKSRPKNEWMETTQTSAGIILKREDKILQKLLPLPCICSFR